MNKPVFLWWAHKEMWNLLVRNPKMSKREALRKLREMYPSINENPIFECFACEAQKDYGHCHTESCPLDWCIGWNIKTGISYGCEYQISDSARHDGLYKMFVNAYAAGCYGLAKTIARKIRDLPLRENAHDLYIIKESPNE